MSDLTNPVQLHLYPLFFGCNKISCIVFCLSFQILSFHSWQELLSLSVGHCILYQRRYRKGKGSNSGTIHHTLPVSRFLFDRSTCYRAFVYASQYLERRECEYDHKTCVDFYKVRSEFCCWFLSERHPLEYWFLTNHFHSSVHGMHRSGRRSSRACRNGSLGVSCQTLLLEQSAMTSYLRLIVFSCCERNKWSFLVQIHIHPR